MLGLVVLGCINKQEATIAGKLSGDNMAKARFNAIVYILKLKNRMGIIHPVLGI
jgi:hypothetical protein